MSRTRSDGDAPERVEDLRGDHEVRACVDCGQTDERILKDKRALRCAACNRKARCRWRQNWVAANHEKQRAIDKRYRDRVMADPERRQEYLDNRRINQRLRRARETGMGPRPVPADVYHKRYGQGFGKAELLPAGPIREVMTGWLTADLHAHNDGRLNEPTQTRLTFESGVSDRAIRRLMKGQAHVSLRTADAIATAIGIPLALLYP